MSSSSDMETHDGDQGWDDEAIRQAIAMSLQDASPPMEQEGIPPGYEPLATQPSPRTSPGYGSPATHPSPRTSAGSVDDHLARPAADAEADGAAAPEPQVVEWSGAHPYFAANPLSGGADTHNSRIIVSFAAPIDRDRTPANRACSSHGR